MKRTLQILAVVTVLTASATWIATGSNSGWTKTSVPVKTLDEITGIEGISYRKQFLPGVDFLGGALIVAGALAGASFLFRNKTKNLTNPN